MTNDDDWDAETESLLDYLARTTREREQKSMHQRDASTSGARSPTEGNSGAQASRARFNDIFEELIHRVRGAADIESQIRTMRVLASWLDDAADQLLARDSVDFHRSSEWH